MQPNNRIIPLPVEGMAREARRADRPEAGSPTIIDLEARRQQVTERAAALASVQQATLLTSGEVWDAIKDDRLVVHYQPQYDLRTGRPIAAEALVRIADLDGTLIYPDRFIDPVERRDLIVPLGRAVIERVCRDLAGFRDAGLPLQRIAINLCAHQLEADPRLVRFVDQMVERFGLRHEDLEFELTERQGLEASSNGRLALNALADRGTRIVIDDFGVGYNSIAYLADLPVAAFKLDRSLTDRILDDKTVAAIVNSLLGLGKTLGLEVVAEGVETKEQSDHLVSAGCRLAQGFGYARPMPVDGLMNFIAEGDLRTQSSGIFI